MCLIVKIIFSLYLSFGIHIAKDRDQCTGTAQTQTTTEKTFLNFFSSFFLTKDQNRLSKVD
jgi:hypothetical protein